MQKVLTKKEENTQLLEECCDALVANHLLGIDDLGFEAGGQSYIISKKSMADFVCYIYNIQIPFDLDKIFSKYKQFFFDSLKEESNQVSKTTGTNFLEE